ncbi:MAG: hypothetical protein JSU07_01790, partial [Bacteroidetes bacterium]|nr:hypothetical protein [Bacteroidota bacterium]
MKRIYLKIKTLALLAMLPIIGKSQFSYSIDVNQSSNTTCMATIGQGGLAQSFQPTNSSLMGAGVYINSGGPTTVTIQVYTNLPTSGGVLLTQGTSTLTNTGSYADVAFSPSITVTPGTTYYLVFTGSNSSACLGGNTSNPYPGGQCYANTGYGSFPSFDYTFRTFYWIGIPGAALNFNGVNNYISVSTNSTISFTGGNAYTIECWMKASGFNSLAGLVSKYQNAFSNGYFLRLLGTAPYTGFDFDGLQTASGILNPNTWYHVAAVNNMGVRTLYLNGVPQTLSGSTPIVVANSDPLTIGVDYLSGARYFNGTIDEVRIWNRALCQGEIQNNMNGELALPQTSLVAYYKLNEGNAGSANPTVTTAISAVGSANNGTLMNFALTGTVSNWVTPGAVVSGSNAPAFVSPSISITGTNSICKGLTTTLTASGSALSTYTWSGGSSSSTNVAVVSPTANASYSVVGTNSLGCVSNMAASSITVNALPSVTVNSGAICSGNSFTINPSGANTYTIQGGSAVVSPTANASYSVVGTNTTTGCSNTATSTINVNALPIVSVNNGTICSGNSFTINPSGANTYTIQGGSAVVSPTANATYSVVGTSSVTGCISNAVNDSVTVNALPVVSVNNGTICSGNSFTINPSGASTYTIQGGSSVVSPTANATYTVNGTSASGCMSSNTTTSSVTVNSLPSVSLSAAQTTACLGASSIALTGSPAGGVYTGSNVSAGAFTPGTT